MLISEAIDMARAEVTGLSSAAGFARALLIGHPEVDRTCLVDGSQYSPSTRAIGNAEQVYQAGYESPEVWDKFTEIIDAYTDAYDVDGYWLGWEEGCLFLFAPVDDDER